MALTTLTLQSLLNFASIHTDLTPFSGGAYGIDPGLQICNDAISSLLLAPYDWDFNRKEMPFFVTAPNRQDYQFGGATVFSLGSTAQGFGVGLATNSGVSTSGGVVTVTTLETHRFAVGDVVYFNNRIALTGNSANATKYNAIFTNNGSTSTWSGGFTVATVPSTTTFTFTAVSGQNNGDALGASGITDFGWLTDASTVSITDTASPRVIRRIQAVSQMQPNSDVNDPQKVCVLTDNGDGTVKLRLNQHAGQTSWAAFAVYQAKPPLKVALTDKIDPFPDHYASVVRQAVIARAYRLINSQRAEVEFQKLQQEIQRALMANDREASAVNIVPEDGGLTGWQASPFWSY